MAYAGAEFTYSLLRAMRGESVTTCTFVESGLTDAPFFSSPVSLGPEGVKEIHGFGTLSPMEQANFDAMVPDLVAQAAKGVKFVADGQ